MLIRYGYEIKLTCPQPTALVCLLSVHEDSAPDIRVPETTFTTPDVPISAFRDLFGNRCRRLVAPAGDRTMPLRGRLLTVRSWAQGAAICL